MKMLGPFLVIVGLLCFSTTTFGELSVKDLEKIRQIVDEAEVRLGKRIDDVEVRLGKRIDEVKVELDKRISTEIQALGKRIDFQGHLIIALIVAIIAFVAVPMGIIVYIKGIIGFGIPML